MEEEFPRKAYYTIGEVSRLTGVPAHVLRYWESEGKLLKPSRRRSRHRLYRLSDIQLILEIKRLREDEKLSLEAMRRQLNPNAHRRPAAPPPQPLRPPEHPLLSLLQLIRQELAALRKLLD